MRLSPEVISTSDNGDTWQHGLKVVIFDFEY